MMHTFFVQKIKLQKNVKKFCDLILSIYKDFGFENVRIKYSDRPEKRVGSDEIWDKSEKALKIAVEATGLAFTHNPGEGAFYGPKLEFILRDAIGRDWQCGTLQVDLTYLNEWELFLLMRMGKRKIPLCYTVLCLVHWNVFAGILIEHYAGRLPLWLSPLQIMIATITSDSNDYAKEVLQQLNVHGLRADIDLRNEKISYKIREHSISKIPMILVVGKKEIEQKTISLRRLGR